MTDTGSIPPAPYTAALILADGTVFPGFGIGAEGTTFGEICFTTGMTGYQETLTDPSFAQQIITFTFPHIGNVGTNEEDLEARRVFASGLVIRQPITNPSNFRNALHLNDWLNKNGVIGLSGIDTRALTCHIRLNGAQNAAICHYGKAEKYDPAAIQRQLANWPAMKGLELAAKVTCDAPYEWTQTEWELGQGYGTLTRPEYHVVAIDFGAKQNILRCLAARCCRVTVVPAQTDAETILGYQPDGIFLSNGPGDPAQTGKYATSVIQALVKSGLPIFGICLGHQLLAQALGAKTEKLPQGHRGANHPVKNKNTGCVEITSQNHGFVVKADALPAGVEETHLSLFDGTNEGICLKGRPVFSVQHHPEASPGPRDSAYLFDQFVSAMKSAKAGVNQKEECRA
ncbi:MAG: glutamine-hydrolyzing carbamoyl-phosphate synthase small subunit [Hyphomicrobiales bacterium]|nr:glutamine-hydrolyzing carbamoyl-phosphate synthase small subunit [Hyphomicrobiales bacterium]